MMTQFDLKDLQNIYQKAFGTKPHFTEKVEVPGYDLNINKAGMPSTALGSKLYGTYGGEVYYMPVLLGGIQLPFPTIRLSRQKKIVETTMVNRSGTVTELISAEDIRIGIQGLCIGNGTWPEEQLVQLRDLEVQNAALKIDCALTNVFLLDKQREGSDTVIITSLDIMETKGYRNIVPYSMTLKSDASFDLIIK